VGAAIESSKKKAGITPVINVTPLVDVVLVLLIIFMLVIPNVQNEGRPIEMIKVDQADRLADDQEPIIVTVDREERYLVGSQELTRDGAVAEVIAQVSASPRQRVLLRADAALRYEPVRELLRLLQEGGVANVALAVGVARNAAESGLGAGLVAEQGEG
jgi:biopolymer transport protein TolR